MKIFFPLLLTFFISCGFNNDKSEKTEKTEMTQSEIKNEKLKDYPFLIAMYNDSYFPNFLVDKGKTILIELCVQVEKDNPKSLPELYKLTHAATNKFNDLEEEFGRNGSEIETAARESIAIDFEFIAETYGYDADIEELIATRDW